MGPVWRTGLYLNANVDAAAQIQARVNLSGIDGGQARIRNDQLLGVLRVAVVLLIVLPGILTGEGLIAQRKLHAVVGRLQARLLQSALELRLLALQQIEGIG